MIEYVPPKGQPQQPLSNAERYRWWLQMIDIHRRCAPAPKPETQH